MFNKVEQVASCDIMQGDCIILPCGTWKTVSREDLSRNTFMGLLVAGIRFPANQVPRVLFPKWHLGKITGWHPQI